MFVYNVNSVKPPVRVGEGEFPDGIREPCALIKGAPTPIGFPAGFSALRPVLAVGHHEEVLVPKG